MQRIQLSVNQSSANAPQCKRFRIESAIGKRPVLKMELREAAAGQKRDSNIAAHTVHPYTQKRFWNRKPQQKTATTARTIQIVQRTPLNFTGDSVLVIFLIGIVDEDRTVDAARNIIAIRSTE